MSSSAQRTPVPMAEDKKKGLSRVLGRMKTVLRRSDGSKRLPFTTKTSTAVEPSASKTAPIPKPIPTAEPPKETPAAIPAAVEAKQTTTPSSLQAETQSKPQSKPQPIKVSRAEINAERARKLGERFQLQIEPHEWQTLSEEKDTWRIEKPIRMRIHRTCHKCNATFGANKICGNCEHPRCTKCPRYPLKKKEKGKGKTALATSGPTPVEVDTEWRPTEKLVLTLPSNRVGGQPLVKKKPMQRVRRTCHECSTLYPVGSKICANCSHARCTDCPRDPPKKKKYPDGYPGDQLSSTTIKFACHICDKTFPHLDTSDPSTSEPECRRCKHIKCDIIKES
ncbi:hypothetical protein EYC80_001816 [Monilinia laxa]|uniref:Uncharacterized protein n=1 Tax=Monilinia laxa TaxID=61186 RepID=A0A5N6K640_MONLA|nr:hypothetical protein EYC80_001816 [Monilinia laxa]